MTDPTFTLGFVLIYFDRSTDEATASVHWSYEDALRALTDEYCYEREKDGLTEQELADERAHIESLEGYEREKFLNTEWPRDGESAVIVCDAVVNRQQEAA